MIDETFNRLVRGMVNAAAAFEGKKADQIEAEIGELVGLAPATIQGYKRGRAPEGRRADKVVEVFAAFGVRRAHLGREWLQRLLDAARYYDAPGLLDRLTPASGSAPPPPPPTSDNLPAPSYGRFIMRPAAYAQLVEGLAERSALVALVSMGGAGKSSLALEVAKRCLGQGDDPPADLTPAPAFDAAVWVAADARPGEVGLAHVLDAVALTLGHPGLTRLGLRELQHEVGQLLRRRRVLVIVDSFESSDDQALLDWLLRLPEPSKAILTTRAYRRELQRGAWLVDLAGMGEAEAQELIGQACRRLHMVAPHPAAARRLWELSGGNPKAIELALGQARYSGQPLEQALDALLLPQGELCDELFSRAWAMLGPEARELLLAAALFVGSARADGLLAVGAGDAAQIQQIADLSLLEVAQAGAAGARYGLHPLTRSFVAARMSEHTDWERAARARWLGWCVAFARQAGGYAIDDLDRLAAIDAEEPTLFAAAGWAVANQRHAEAVALIRAIEFYYYVRALWGKKLALHELYIAAARALGDCDEEIAALALQIQLLSRQGRLAEAAAYLPRLHALAAAGPLSVESRFSYRHTLGVYSLAGDDLPAARACWEQLLAERDLVGHMYIGAHHWLARCLERAGRPDAAHDHFAAALELARQHGFGRMVASNQLGLARLDLAAGELESAAQRLAECRQIVRPGDWEQQAHLLWASARLAERRGARAEAAAQYAQAQALFERMGLSREGAELGAELHAQAGA